MVRGSHRPQELKMCRKESVLTAYRFAVSGLESHFRPQGRKESPVYPNTPIKQGEKRGKNIVFTHNAVFLWHYGTIAECALESPFLWAARNDGLRHIAAHVRTPPRTGHDPESGKASKQDRNRRRLAARVGT